MTEAERSWPVLAATFSVAVLATAAALVVSQSLARSFSLVVYLVAMSAALVDLLDLAARLFLCRRSVPAPGKSRLETTSVPLAVTPAGASHVRAHLRPYAIVASVHNAQDNLHEFTRAMGRYRERCWLIDDASSDATAELLRRAGWRCVAGPRNQKKPGALRTLLAQLPPEIETVLVIDPDIVIRDTAGAGNTGLDALVFEFQASGMAAMCPRIAILEDGLLARFQGLEYCMSFSLGRRSLGAACVNSGISLYRRDDLAAALERHSLSVYAEDLENSLLLLQAGRPIYYDGRLVVDTEGKRSWGGWFSQLVGWNYGLARVYAERFGAVRAVSAQSARNAYHFLVYTGILGIALQPVKLAGLALLALGLVRALDELLGVGLVPQWDVADPAYLLAAYLKYTVIAVLALFVAVPPRERRPLLPIVPLYFFYALAHIVPVSVGYANWVSVRLRGRRLFADHYQEEAGIAASAASAKG